jgi:hypothetical protein
MGGIAGMKLCKMHLVRVCLFLVAAVPAYSQKSTFGIDIGQTSDKFGAQPSVSGAEFGIDGQLTILHANPKKERPAIVAGGEIILPSDTGNHAKEYAIFGGPRFEVHGLTIGLNAQVRKIVLPTANVENQFFIRNKMELLEIPLVFRYSFGKQQRAFLEAEGAPEFSPRFRSAGSPVGNPKFDHGYFVRGTAGYIFGKWYAKAAYEDRYFKFAANGNNPLGLYNWRTNRISGGIGVSF